MSKVPSKLLKVYDPIFNQRIAVFVNKSQEEYKKWEKRMNVANPSEVNFNIAAWSTHISADGEPNTYIIYLPKFQWTLDDQATLIHECIHTVVRIWESNNISFVPETQEFFAHSVDRLYSTIAAKLLTRRKKK